MPGLPWLHLDAALELIGRDQGEALVRACRDGDIHWRIRDKHGDLLERPDWTGEVNWSTHPPQFEIQEPLYFFVPGKGMPTSGPRIWREAEVERRSLLACFDEPEPLAVRIVGPVGIVLEWAKTAFRRKQSGPKPSGQRQDRAIRRAIDRMIANGEIGSTRGERTQAARELQERFPDYKLDTLRRKISDGLGARRPK